MITPKSIASASILLAVATLALASCRKPAPPAASTNPGQAAGAQNSRSGNDMKAGQMQLPNEGAQDPNQVVGSQATGG